MDRRSFLKLVGISAGTIALQACGGGQVAPASSAAPPASASAAAKPASAAASAIPSGLRKVTYGEVGNGFTVNVAIDQGFFAEQGIEIEKQRFDSAANMVAPLGSGQLDCGQGAISAGLWNAVSRGVNVKAVADGGHTAPDWPQQELMVRKELFDNGKVKKVADLKGMKIGTGIRGTSTDYAIYRMLQKNGLTFADIEQVPMGPLDLGVALANGKVDAAVFIQPAATQMLNQGLAVHLMWDYEAVPSNQALTLLLGSQFADSDPAVPFVTAFVKGVRLYNDALGKKLAEAKNKLFDAAVKLGPEKDRKVYEAYTFFFAIDPDGKLDLKSLQDQQDWFVQTGAQTSKLDLAKVVDPKYAEQVVARIGPYA